jgi:hypothetical protein
MGRWQGGVPGWFYPSTRQHCVIRNTYKSPTRQVTRQKASTSRQVSQFWPFWLRLAFDSELPDNCLCVDGDPTN